MSKKDINKYPKISIITVCLNSDKTISRCIDSVLNQTIQKIKLNTL